MTKLYIRQNGRHVVLADLESIQSIELQHPHLNEKGATYFAISQAHKLGVPLFNKNEGWRCEDEEELRAYYNQLQQEPPTLLKRQAG